MFSSFLFLLCVADRDFRMCVGSWYLCVCLCLGSSLSPAHLFSLNLFHRSASVTFLRLSIFLVSNSLNPQTPSPLLRSHPHWNSALCLTSLCSRLPVASSSSLILTLPPSNQSLTYYLGPQPQPHVVMATTPHASVGMNDSWGGLILVVQTAFVVACLCTCWLVWQLLVSYRACIRSREMCLPLMMLSSDAVYLPRLVFGHITRQGDS